MRDLVRAAGSIFNACRGRAFEICKNISADVLCAIESASAGTKVRASEVGFFVVPGQSWWGPPTGREVERR
jgi:hypothetical protein